MSRSAVSLVFNHRALATPADSTDGGPHSVHWVLTVLKLYGAFDLLKFRQVVAVNSVGETPQSEGDALVVGKCMH